MVWRLGFGVEVDGVDLVDVVDGVAAIRRWGEWAMLRDGDAAKIVPTAFEDEDDDEYESEPGRGRPAAP